MVGLKFRGAGLVCGDGKCFLRGIDKLVKDVALPRREAEFFDRGADLVERQIVHRAGLGDDVFLDHQAAHVVGAVEQGELADLQALRDPARLDVGEVVEIQPADGLGFQIFERAGRRARRPCRCARAETSSR